jgi:fermentation-respiration switch protein FrsA (DUF1100 family)
MRKVGVPKLFIHSKNDEIVPFILGRRLYEASGEPRRFIEIRGAHNTAFLDSQEKYVSSLVSFMAGLGGR